MSLTRKYTQYLFSLMGFCLLWIAQNVLAAEPAPSLGTIAEHLVGGTDIVTHLMHFVSIMVGIMLLVMAGGFYKAHRFNPKLVPLEKPIIYVILALVAMIIPFLGKIFGPTGSTHDIEKQELIKKGVEIRDIDTPLEEWGNDYDH